VRYVVVYLREKRDIRQEAVVVMGIAPKIGCAEIVLGSL
jgi:hypothetical protein